MGFMALALVVAVLVVVATHGSLRQLAQLPIEGFGMLFLALGIQAALNIVHIPKARVDDVGFGLLMLSYACILGFCFANLRLRGMAIITIGIALNAIVIALNQGMPANGPTRVDAQGQKVSTVATSVKHRPERPGDVLTVLDDRIVIRQPFHEILSFGDLILALGLIDVCYWGSRRDERERLSVFALSELPAPPRPKQSAPSAPSAAPAHAATSMAADDVDLSEPEANDDERVEPPPDLDLTAALFVDPADAAWHTTSSDVEPPESPARSEDEVETALWLAAP